VWTCVSLVACNEQVKDARVASWLSDCRCEVEVTQNSEKHVVNILLRGAADSTHAIPINVSGIEVVTDVDDVIGVVFAPSCDITQRFLEQLKLSIRA